MDLPNRYIIPAFMLLLVLTIGLYALGLGGGFHFDDAVNLQGLDKVADIQSAWDFLREGRAGPLGRPISLLSFTLQAQAWPAHPEQFLLANLSLHVINGLLLFGLVLSLTRHLQNSSYIALITTAFWLLCPLLASSSFLIVQRMTLLNGLFTILGLWSYTISRQSENLRLNLVGSVLSLGVFGVLAGLSKENGLLLPLYALVLEIFWFRHHKHIFNQLSGKLVFLLPLLATPAILLFIYFIFNFNAIEVGYKIRDFTMLERLQTQLVILWDYLFKVLFPRAGYLGPFHDDYLIRTGFVVFVSGLGWVVTVLGSVFLRKKHPLLGLAVFWYLFAHLLESSFFPLELYFEHRNYIALIGVFFAVTVTLLSSESLVNFKLGLIAIGFFLVLNITVLYQLSSSWGQPIIGASIWYKAHPNSPRAIQFLVQQYILHDNFNKASLLLQKAALDNPSRGDLALQSLQLDCPKLSFSELQMRLQNLFKLLPISARATSVVDALDGILIQINNGSCKLEIDQLLALSDVLLKNGKFYSDPTIVYALHHHRARIYRQLALLNETMLELDAAFAVWPRVETAIIAVGTLLSAGLMQEAEQWMNKVEKQPHLAQQSAWQNSLSALNAAIQSQRQQSNHLSQE